MAKQDDYVRYTIRVPSDLYARLQEAAGEKSVNAEIITRLLRSLNAGGPSIHLNITVIGQNDIAERVGAAARAAIQDVLSGSCGVTL